MSYFEEGATYPPTEHQARINKYRRNERLFRGNHYEVFTQFNNNPNGLLYLSMNITGLICKKSTDFLFGEDVRVLSRDGDEEQQKVFNDMIEDNDLDTLNYESALANAYRGDSFYKLRYGREFSDVYPEEINPNRIFIEPLNAAYVFPHTNPFNLNLISWYEIATPTQDENGDWYLLVEMQYPGRIEYTQYKMTPTKTETFQGVTYYTEWTIGEEVGERTEENTGVPVPLVVHIPNFGTDSTWEGIDDISELIPLFDEINNRLTQIAAILDKHADPALAVPNGTIEEDENGNSYFNVAYNKVFEIDGQDDVMPKYITWNGQIFESFKELELLLKMAFTIAEIPSVVLGDGESGTSGNSGLAIQMQMNTLLAKVNRKRQYYRHGLKELFLIGQMLMNSAGQDMPFELTKPRLVFSDGLPTDYATTANVMAVVTGGQQTASVKSALMKYQNLTELEADAEIERMKREKMDQACFNTKVMEMCAPEIEEGTDEEKPNLQDDKPMKNGDPKNKKEDPKDE